MERIIKPEIFKKYKEINAGFSRKISAISQLQLKTPVFSINQIHSDNVVIIKSLDDISRKYNGDAIITNVRGLTIGVKTADCLGAVIYDPENLVIAAVHSGWRSTAKRIITSTIKTMIKEYNSKPDNILVAFGPAICGRCYNVGEDVIREMEKVFEDGFYNRIEGRFYIDLKFLNKQLLLKEGVKQENIEVLLECTCCNSDYQSYRRDKNTRMFQFNFICIE